MQKMSTIAAVRKMQTLAYVNTIEVQCEKSCASEEIDNTF